MTTIKPFYAKQSRYKAGILIEPLPDASQVLIDRIAKALKAIDIECIHFIITDLTSVPAWCEAVGVQGVTDTFLGIWILDKDPETCIDVVRDVVERHEQ